MKQKFILNFKRRTNLFPFLIQPFLVCVRLERWHRVGYNGRKKKLNEIDTEIDTSQQIYSFRLVFISLRCVPYSLLCVIPTSPILFYNITTNCIPAVDDNTDDDTIKV